NELRTLNLKHASRKGPRWKIEMTGAVAFKDATAMIKAGNRLYVGRPGKVAAVALPLPEDLPLKTEFAWEADIVGTPVSLVAADDRLFASTKEGRIYCFGPGSVSVPAAALTTFNGDVSVSPTFAAGTVAVAGKIGITEGYAVVWSAD